MAADYSWTPAPVVLLLLAGSATLYARRWREVRCGHGVRGASAWRLASFNAGLLLVGAALISPVDRLSEQLAAMHMVQHVLLLDLAPILCILGLSRILLRPVTRRVQRLERAAGPLAHPATAVVAYVGLLWLWHVPTLYDAALAHVTVHVVEHTCFTIAGGLYWWHLLSPIRSRMRLVGMQTVMYMASTKVLVGMLGILLTFSPDTLYHYSDQARIWGLSHLDDQNLSGAVMAIEQAIVMGTALAVLFARGLLESERAQQRAERYELDDEELAEV